MRVPKTPLGPQGEPWVEAGDCQGCQKELPGEVPFGWGLDLTIPWIFVRIQTIPDGIGRCDTAGGWPRNTSVEEVRLMRITLHIGAFTVTIIVKRRNRHSGK